MAAKSVAKKPIGVIRFPGTNCDRDVFKALESMDQNPAWLWHGDLFDVSAYSALVLPGGFSFGDYLRSGALAARSRVMASVREAAGKGVPILGICNGFQILCEAQLLPGALVRNHGLRFIDRWLELKIESSSVKGFGRGLSNHKGPLRLPIAHADGRYVADEETLARIVSREQVWLKYTANPNGSVLDIAGICSEARNVMGLMPHPERAMEAWMGSTDGRTLIEFALEEAL